MANVSVSMGVSEGDAPWLEKTKWKSGESQLLRLAQGESCVEDYVPAGPQTAATSWVLAFGAPVSSFRLV
jgi:hypothetical protein